MPPKNPTTNKSKQNKTKTSYEKYNLKVTKDYFKNISKNCGPANQSNNTISWDTY